MRSPTVRLPELLRDDYRVGGQGIVEYALILGLGALVAVVILVFIGDPLSAVLEFIARLIDEATHGG